MMVPAQGQTCTWGYAFSGASSFRIGYRQFGEQSGEVFTGGMKIGEYEVDADGLYLAADIMFPLADTVYLGALGLQNWDGESITTTALGTSKSSSDGRDFSMACVVNFFSIRGTAVLSRVTPSTALKMKWVKSWNTTV